MLKNEKSPLDSLETVRENIKESFFFTIPNMSEGGKDEAGEES